MRCEAAARLPDTILGVEPALATERVCPPRGPIVGKNGIPRRPGGEKPRLALWLILGKKGILRRSREEDGPRASACGECRYHPSEGGIIGVHSIPPLRAIYPFRGYASTHD
jgi:hypothetical protein